MSGKHQTMTEILKDNGSLFQNGVDRDGRNCMETRNILEMESKRTSRQTEFWGMRVKKPSVMSHF